jgi:hypothetical protein
MVGVGRKTEDRKVGARFIALFEGVSRGRDESRLYLTLFRVVRFWVSVARICAFFC